MSEITEALLKEIKNLDLKRYYKEPICMIPVSKNFRGEFDLADRDRQQCKHPECETLKALHRMKLEVRSNRPCDSVAARRLDGTIEGQLLFAFIENGNQRGFHKAKIEWTGATSVLQGQMSGMTNAGTHRDPLRPCERCDERGHMEGCLDAVVVKGDHKGCRLLATYVIEFDSSTGSISTAVEGTLEGVLICDCK